MALPATDNFTAANGTVLTAYSASWTADRNNFVINTNALAPGVFFAQCCAKWNADVFNNDQYSQATVAAMDATATIRMGVCVREASGNFYGFTVTQGSRKLYVLNAGAETVLASDTTTCTVGDVLKIVAAGTTISAYVNGTQIFSVTDSALSSGSAGVAGEGHFSGLVTQRIDNWEGGNGSGTSFNPTQTVTETGAGADADSGVRASTIAETGSGADADSGVRLATIAETGSGADTTSSARLATIAEAGSGADASTSATLGSAADSATASDTASAAGSGAASDTGSGVDTSAGATLSSSTDAASAADSASSAGAGTASDSGAGVDAPAGLIAATVAESASGVDATSASGSGTGSTSDSGSGVDAAASSFGASSTDSASGADLPSGLLQISVADVATAVDLAFVGGLPAIICALAQLGQQTKPSAVLAQLGKPIAIITPAARVATLTQHTKPSAVLAQVRKPIALLEHCRG